MHYCAARAYSLVPQEYTPVPQESIFASQASSLWQNLILVTQVNVVEEGWRFEFEFESLSSSKLNYYMSFGRFEPEPPNLKREPSRGSNPFTALFFLSRLYQIQGVRGDGFVFFLE